MAERQIKTRIINKHDTEANWIKATNFIPKSGELIIYDIDSDHSYERFKIGDGSTTVSNLPWTYLDIENGTTLTAGADLNNIKSAGVYSCSDSIGQTVLNSPYKYGFKLEVRNWRGYNLQELWGQSNEHYSRVWTGSKWTDWSTISSREYVKEYVDESITNQKFKTINDQTITGSGNLNIYEEYLEWGGKNRAGNFGPVDAALIPVLGANRLAFMPANAIDIEYSRNGGTTWVDCEAADSTKINLFNDIGTGIIIGNDTQVNIDKSQYMIRVTINTEAARVYTVLNKFAIYMTSNGSTGSYCTIAGRLQADVTAGTETWRTFVDKASLQGWSGWNILNTSITTYGNTSAAQYGQVRFIFGVTSHSSDVKYGGLQILKILGFGGVGWNVPSTLARTGKLYTWDWLQNAYFPASVYTNNKQVATIDQVPGMSNKALGFKYIEDSSDTTIILDAGTSTTVI